MPHQMPKIQGCNIQKVIITRGAFGEIYEPAWNRTLNDLGIKSKIFDTHSLTLPGILGRIERRILWGPGISRIKRKFVALIKSERPDVTLLYQGHYFDRETLEEIRHFTFIAGYHNDDPFGARKTMLRYRLLLPALPSYHGFHVYRSCNVEEALAYGVPKVKILMPYYLPWLDYPRKLNGENRNRWGTDVMFAGHVENDFRVECLTKAVRLEIKVRIYGENRFWKPALFPDVYEKIKPIKKVVGEDYRKALSGAKIAACFFSRWNRDQYTRRVFEIPACKVFLLSERTAEMQSLYEEGGEAEYFDTPEEFLDKAKYYLKNDTARQRIAEAGYCRAVTSGYDIYSRMKQWLADVTQWREELAH
jgi:spore maturation protein CgeB